MVAQSLARRMVVVGWTSSEVDEVRHSWILNVHLMVKITEFAKKGWMKEKGSNQC